MLNKREMLLVLQMRTRRGEKQPAAEHGHLQAGLICLPKGESWSSTIQPGHRLVFLTAEEKLNIRKWRRTWKPPL